MNTQITQQAEKVLQAAQEITMQDIKLPKDVQAAAMEGLKQTREACEKLADAARDAGKSYGGVMAIAQNGAKVLGEKVLDNSEKNSEALFEAAKAVMRCKDLAEVAKVQADFVKAQAATANAQAKELYELSSKITKETVDAANSAASKTMTDLKSVA